MYFPATGSISFACARRTGSPIARQIPSSGLRGSLPGLYIFYDYAGIEKWCSGEWKTNKNGTRKYKEFYDEISKKVKVHFVKVKGHSNDHYNDLADKLAKKALGIG